MQHVMIDLETFGTKPNALFPTMAAVQFDLITGEVGSVFYRRILIQDAINKKLTIDAQTLQWWMMQRPEVMRLMFDDPANPAIHLQDAMGDFHEWFMRLGLVYPWGNSASFDLKILEHGLRVSFIEVPWKFHNERCYRTVLAMTPVDLPKPADSHNPVADCKYQIEKLCLAYHKLNDKKEKPVYRFNPDDRERSAGDDNPIVK